MNICYHYIDMPGFSQYFEVTNLSYYKVYCPKIHSSKTNELKVNYYNYYWVYSNARFWNMDSSHTGRTDLYTVSKDSRRHPTLMFSNWASGQMWNSITISPICSWVTALNNGLETVYEVMMCQKSLPDIGLKLGVWILGLYPKMCFIRSQ